MAIGCCNLIIFCVCEAKRALRRSQRTSRSRRLWARVPRIPAERRRGRPKRPERAAARGRLHTGVCASAARTSRLSAQAICQQTSPSKIAGSSTFEWSFPILTGLLCSVRSHQRTRIVSSALTLWRNRVIFSFGSRATLAVSWSRGRVWVTVPSTYMESSPWWSQCSNPIHWILWCLMIYGK